MSGRFVEVSTNRAYYLMRDESRKADLTLAEVKNAIPDNFCQIAREFVGCSVDAPGFLIIRGDRVACVPRASGCGRGAPNPPEL